MRGDVLLTSVYVEDAAWPQHEPLRCACYCRGASFAGAHYTGQCKGTCGIYAWSHGIIALEPIPHRAWMEAKSLIHGEVNLWGVIHVHEYGYRAEIARPSCFYVSDGMSTEQRIRTELAAMQYDVPLMAIPVKRPVLG